MRSSKCAWRWLRIGLMTLQLTVLVLSGCGGGVGGTGGGGGGGGEGGGGGVGGTGIVSQGTVTKAEPAAVIVNATAYQVTVNTKVTIDANTASVTDLQPGMVVEVEAVKSTTLPESEAQKITYKNTLIGPIGSISANCNSMIVLGQVVEADAHTLPTLARGLCDFTAGQVVEISGFISNPVLNSVRATFIRVTAPSQNVSVSGTIASVSVAQKLLVIGALTIDYAGAMFKPAGAVPEADKFAQIQGIATGPDTVTASEIEITTPGLGGAAGSEAEVTGFISQFSGSTFSVSGQAIDSSRAKISPTTAILADGVKVEVHGTLNSSGILEATEIDVKTTSPIEIETTN